MGSILARMGTVAAGARGALGRAASSAGERINRGWQRARGWARNLGTGAVGYAGGRGTNGNGGSGNDPDEEFSSSDYNANYSRSTQLVALNTPIEAGGGFSEPQGKGTFDPAIVQILRSIDANIRAMRDSISMISATNTASRGPASRLPYGYRRQYQGDYALTGIGLLGLGAGALSGNNRTPGSFETAPGEPQPPPANNSITGQNQTPPAPEISSVVQQPTETIQQSLGLQNAPNNDVLSQPATPQNREAHQRDIAQLRTTISETRASFQENIANNRNQRQNRNIVSALLSDAENSLPELERLYQTQNPDMDAIADLRRQILERVQSARNYITPNITPQENNRSPETTTPGPQSSIEQDNMVNVVNDRNGNYFNSYNTNEENRNSYINYLVSAMSNNNSISIQGKELTNLDIISGNEDNVSRRLEAIQVKNDVTPIIIDSGGGNQSPTIIQQTAPQQQNTPAPLPGTGDINIGYRSHPMLINEPRSPAIFSHP